VVDQGNVVPAELRLIHAGKEMLQDTDLVAMRSFLSVDIMTRQARTVRTRV
jgi:hypothetical protein